MNDACFFFPILKKCGDQRCNRTSFCRFYVKRFKSYPKMDRHGYFDASTQTFPVTEKPAHNTANGLLLPAGLYTFLSSTTGTLSPIVQNTGGGCLPLGFPSSTTAPTPSDNAFGIYISSIARVTIVFVVAAMSTNVQGGGKGGWGCSTPEASS